MGGQGFKISATDWHSKCIATLRVLGRKRWGKRFCNSLAELRESEARGTPSSGL